MYWCLGELDSIWVTKLIWLEDLPRLFIEWLFFMSSVPSSPPVRIQASAISNAAVSVSWDEPVEANGPITVSHACLLPASTQSIPRLHGNIKPYKLHLLSKLTSPIPIQRNAIEERRKCPGCHTMTNKRQLHRLTVFTRWPNKCCR